MRRLITTAAGLVAALTLAGATAAPLALAASKHPVRFKALYWRVWTADSTGYASPHKAKLGSRYVVCSMDRVNELEFDYSDAHAVTRGTPYTFVLSGPGGASVKLPFAARYANGKSLEGWSANGLPPFTSSGVPNAGVYRIIIRAHGKTLARASITLASSNTCT